MDTSEKGRALWFVVLGDPRRYLRRHYETEGVAPPMDLDAISEQELGNAVESALRTKEAEAYASVGSNEACGSEWCRIAYVKTDGTPVGQGHIRRLFLGQARISETQGEVGDIRDFLSQAGRWDGTGNRCCCPTTPSPAEPSLDWLTLDYLDSLFGNEVCPW